MGEVILSLAAIIFYGAFMVLVGFGLGRFDREAAKQNRSDPANDGGLAVRSDNNDIPETGTGE